ncbi:transglycosylase domain-containing protein [Streptomyces sp. NBC_00083]|uniref:transglycosylase domain-containing protein n=1 Tax=Streptomyces sp. NBC_00083 TaxID=2975647 RepID=UPI002256F929|nr:transglycosylase domain-containing protein [Streptomyces sp. NBC_00083]MCX5382212.1 transglycosylase domain-containing protein [Streptomyces sp. NBC_00083]
MSDDEQPESPHPGPQPPRTWTPRDLGPAGAEAGAGAGAAGAAGSGTGTEPGAPDDGPAGDGADGSGPAQNGAGAGGRRPRRTGWRRFVPRWRVVLGVFLVCALLLIGAFIAGYTLVSIPPANAVATAQSNVFLYADGTQLASDGEVNRENVQLAQIPLTVQHAVLAAEDRDFYSERAVDPKAMVRAAWNTLTGKGTQGGSTITQQYVKNYYLGQEQTVTRKVKEFFIAIKLNREETKEDILAGYLNTSYFGRNAYGIQAASQAYYSKNVEQLTTGEGAYLASLLNSPSAYDVISHPENKPRALARWNYVLDGMVKKKWLSPAERAATTFPVPGKVKPRAGLAGQRGYLVEAVKDYLTSNKIIDENTLATGGYRITTTIEKDKQDAFVKAVDDKVNSKLSSVRKADRTVRVGGASIDPSTGNVVAMYGGIDYTKQYVNNATRRDFQVGSTFKPFVFTSAVANGSTTQEGRVITPNTLYDGTNKRPVQGWKGGYYAPANEDDISYGQITVRTATDKSVNAVYAQMAVDVGPAKVKQSAIDLGIPATTPDLVATPSIALGPATASVLDMTQAYATLAGHGRHGTYTMVASVTKDGEKTDLPSQDTEQAVSREAADTTTSMLQSVVDGGTGTAAQASGRPSAGKTGTAEQDKAAWFAGYTPDLATVVAVMGADPDTAVQQPLYGALGLPRMNGGGPPAQIWAQYTKGALQGTEVKDFDLELQDGANIPVEPPSPPNPFQTPTPGVNQGQTQGQGQDQGQTQGQNQGGTGGRDQGQTQGQNQGRTQGQSQGQNQGQTQGQNQGTQGGADNEGATQGQNQGAAQGQNQGQTQGQTQGGTTDGGATAGTDNGGTQGGTTEGVGGTTAGAADRPQSPRIPWSPTRP